MRILLLRPEGQAQASAMRLEARGHQAVVAPILRVEATAEPPPTGPFAAIVVTSINALPALGSLRGPSALPAIFAVGRRTGIALAQAGFGDVASASEAVSLARLIAGRMAPARLLLVAGRDRKCEPEASLKDAGFEVVLWEAYQAVIAAELPDAIRQALAEAQLDIVLHYSRRSAEAALTLIREAGLEPEFSMLHHACLSADVAAGLDGIPPERIATSPRPDEDALLALLDDGTEFSAQARARRNPGAKDGTISPACVCRTANG